MVWRAHGAPYVWSLPGRTTPEGFNRQKAKLEGPFWSGVLGGARYARPAQYPTPNISPPPAEAAASAGGGDGGGAGDSLAECELPQS